jgi:hypothetical protein
MLSKDLKVVSLCVTEDYYDYKGTFQLHGERGYMEIDLSDLTDEKTKEIKGHFNLEECLEDIKDTIMAKVLESANIECKIVEGKNY